MEARFIYLLGDIKYEFHSDNILLASQTKKRKKKSIHLPISSKVKIKPPQKSVSSFNNKLNIIYLDKHMGFYLNSLH